jgi:CBS domain-containing protein
MKIGEIMTDEVETAAPDDTLRSAAKMMQALDVDILPVGENDRLVGMVTDRDIAVRGIAEDMNPDKATVGEVMTEALQYCYEDDDEKIVRKRMSDLQIRRMPVLDHDRRLVGMVSIDDLAVLAGSAPAGRGLKDVSHPADPAYAGSKPGADKS